MDAQGAPRRAETAQVDPRHPLFVPKMGLQVKNSPLDLSAAVSQPGHFSRLTAIAGPGYVTIQAPQFGVEQVIDMPHGFTSSSVYMFPLVRM